MSIDPPAARPSRLAAAWNRVAFVALPALATAACLLLDNYTSLTSKAMLYVLAVVIASYSVSPAAALVSSLLCVMLLNFFFVQPRFTLTAHAGVNVTALIAMFAVAVVISHRGTVLRRETQQARQSEARARQLQALATALADIDLRTEVQRTGEEFLRAAFGADSRVDLADGDPTPAALTLPLVSQNRIEGYAHVPRAAVAEDRAFHHAHAICSLLGQALGRLRLKASVHEAEEKSRWHRAQNTFLAGISHDFRTPLAAMVAAASSLQTQHDKLGIPEQQRLARIIQLEAAHLATLTDNTLQLARLENAGEIDRDWQSIEEIVGSVLARVRQRDGQGRIQASVPPGLPLIQADPVLLAQMLDNLLDNALKYSPDRVDLVVSREGERLRLAVEDRGGGVAAGEEEAIFEPFRRSDRTGKRGAGLGLAVCRAIARAHGGELGLQRRDGGGTVFWVRLPVQPLAVLATEPA